MSHENVDVARQVMAALSARDAERLIELTDPDVGWKSFFGIGVGTYRGPDGMRQYLRDLDDSFDTARADVDDALAVEDVVVLVGRLHYRGKTSGVENEIPAGWMLKFREGKLLTFRAFREPAEALEAVGRSE